MNLLQWIQLFQRVRARLRQTPTALLATLLVGTGKACCRRKPAGAAKRCASSLNPRACRCPGSGGG